MTEQRVKPLLVRCQARSGSTWLMRCLSQLDGIAVALHPPCEVRYAQYMAAAYDVMTGKADLEQSSRPNFFHLDNGEKWIGRNPFNRRLAKGYHRYFGDQYRKDFRDFFIRQVEGFYEHVARRNGVACKWFCEKALYISNRDWRQSADEIFSLYPEGIHALYLVRDPRDIFCSNRAFFHEGEGGRAPDLKAAMKGLAGHTDAMAAAFAKYRLETKRIVHYEDLMQRPADSVRGIAEWLGLDPGADDIDAAVAFATRSGRSHKTAGSASASIGRWRNELDADLARHANRCFAKYRSTFGYD